MLPSTVNYTRSMQRMPATLLISLKLILFAMEMEERKKTPLLQNSQGNTAHFPQKKTPDFLYSY